MFNNSNGYSLADLAAATGNNENGWGGNGAWWIILLFFALGWGGNGWGGFGGNGGGGAAMQGALTRGELCQDMNFADLMNGVRGVQSSLSDSFYTLSTNMLNSTAGLTAAVTNAQTAAQLGFDNTNLAMIQGQNALGTQMQTCCCEMRDTVNQANFANLQNQNAISRQLAEGFTGIQTQLASNANALQTQLASTTRDIIDNDNANQRALMNYLTQEKIADLQSENQALRFQASQQAQNNYLIDQLAPKVPTAAYVVPNPFTGTTSTGCGCMM